MIYILETDLSEKKSIYFSLTKIFGINKFNACLICKKVGLAHNLKVYKLTPDQIIKLITLKVSFAMSIASTETNQQMFILFQKRKVLHNKLY